VATDFADYIEGTPGRFVPHEMRGSLVEAEHLARYLWAMRFAEGRRVLDAGCGMAYGAAMLSEAGAKSVVGLDIAEAVLEAARTSVPSDVELVTGDVRELPFASGAFDLVVCFEVIEHIHEQECALGEFRRVLASDGLLLLSSPNRDVYMPGNPHHVHELTPQELETLLMRHFDAARLVRQHAFVASAVLKDDSLRSDHRRAISDQAVYKIADSEPGEETYTLAIAGNRSALMDGTDLMVVTAPIEVRRWYELFREQQAELERYAAALDDVDRRLNEREELLERLAEAEDELAKFAPLQRRLALADAERRDANRELEAALAARRRVEESRSWRLTSPLRRAAALMRLFRRLR
jgi:SAM-dependent methyltransferase